MRNKALLLVLLVVLSALPVIAQYTEARRYAYTTPRIEYYPTSACIMVDVDQADPTCYRDGVSMCARSNSGYCFQNCVQHVRNICFNSRRIPLVPVFEGWEKQFKDRRDCERAVPDLCATSVTSTQYHDCMRRAYTRCSYIGRMFV